MKDSAGQMDKITGLPDDKGIKADQANLHVEYAAKQAMPAEACMILARVPCRKPALVAITE